MPGKMPGEIIGHVFQGGDPNVVAHIRWGTESPFRADLFFGYARNGSERTSFSGSTVTDKVLYFKEPLSFNNS